MLTTRFLKILLAPHPNSLTSLPQLRVNTSLHRNSAPPRMSSFRDCQSHCSYCQSRCHCHCWVRGKLHVFMVPLCAYLFFNIGFFQVSLIYFYRNVEWTLWGSKKCSKYLSMAFMTKLDIGEMTFIWEFMYSNSEQHVVHKISH